MNPVVRVVMGVMLAVLWLPAGMMAGEIQTTATQQSTKEAQAGSVSSETKGKKSDRQDVQSRGLFSKKKKKKPTGGGAAAHSQAPEHTDSPKSMGEP